MRLREVLVALIDETKINHWNAVNAVWAHASTDCLACKAAMEAQTALTINFVDLAVGDPVCIGHGPSPLHVGVVEHVGMVVDVKLGYAHAQGVVVGPNATVGRFNPTALTRLDRSG